MLVVARPVVNMVWKAQSRWTATTYMDSAGTEEKTARTQPLQQPRREQTERSTQHRASARLLCVLQRQSVYQQSPWCVGWGRLAGGAAEGVGIFTTWKAGMSRRKVRRIKMVRAKKRLRGEGREGLLCVCSWLRRLFQQGPHWEVSRRELFSWMSANTSLPGREMRAGAGIHRKWFMPCNLCKK